MPENSLFLLLVLAVGVASNNGLLASAAGILLFLQFSGLSGVIEFCEEQALQFGLILLMVAVLAPFASNRVGISKIGSSLTSLAGVLAIIGGATATFVNGQGVALLRTNPEVIAGLLLGTIAGVCFLKGIPVGPLAAAGVTALLLDLLNRWR